ncbi:MAG: UvrD-helicase domain-containing protein [Eggerthellaceae bacterium]|jgi:DNA helicase-2/ATP-dependent DNA helicase PcrA|nr:UvrD-helicase domain-containing protein [Eggerthellaceae bacterium]
MPIDLDTLNGPQREAVLCTEGPLLVLAGAGSGKTRVLTHRIAHLVEDLNVAPWQIMAITFTNKAAAEMRERLQSLIGGGARGMWVSTFHSMCVRILRTDCERVGFAKGFTIYDDSDSKRLVEQIMDELNIDKKRYPIPALRNRISQAKNDLQVAEVFAEKTSDQVGQVAARVYTHLQERLRQLNAFDFDDLLLYTWLLLKNHPDVLAAYQNRFRYLMVDEYQDTNHAQYVLTQLLAAAHKNIMVVGDDDQSIYSWRGADLRNILDFEKDYPEARVVKLEENYRSMGNILAAANAVIANNLTRKPKKLFTSKPAGDKISVYSATDERDEGRWIASEIEHQHGEGMSYNQIAVFYRTNAQSRMLEDMLMRAGVPYRLIGGTRFFDRAEIRDVMAYLNLVVNPANDVAAHRVINVPKRGIGKTTVEHIDYVARETGITFLQAAELCIADDQIRSATRKAIAEFVALIHEAQGYAGDLRKVVEAIVDKAGLIRVLEAENSDDAAGRIENIQELFGVVDEYAQTHDDADALFEPPTAEDAPEADDEPPVRTFQANSLPDFVEWVTLRTDMDTVAEDGEAITMMTIHAAKGLEFDCVFVAGMEESLFPHGNSSQDSQGLEEERRLAYVAITRARKKLYLTNAFTRQIFGQSSANPPSRFIGEIPLELRKGIGMGSAGFSGSGWEKRGSRRGIAGSGSEAGGGRVFGQSSASGSRPRQQTRPAVKPEAQKKAAAKMTFTKGDTVDHKVFGRGTITKVDGDTLHVRFSRTGQTKKLLKDYAPIVKIG